MRADWVRLLQGIRAEREASLDAYARILAEVQRRADAPEIDPARSVLEREFAGRGLAELAPFLDVAGRHGALEGLPERQRLLAEVLAAGRGADPSPPRATSQPTPPRAAAPPAVRMAPAQDGPAASRGPSAPPGTGATVTPGRP
jgi:hypothetical protein